MRHLLMSVVLATAPVAGVVAAAEFRSAGESAVILYDAPSVKGRKLYIVNQGYPLEVMVQVEGWVKVRDATGTLAWAESKALNTARTVLVRSASVNIRQKPADDAPSLAEVRRDVLLNVVEPASGGWIQVRHRDGATGFVRAADVWGD